MFQDSTQALRQWLAKPETQQLLLKIARNLADNMEHQHIGADFVYPVRDQQDRLLEIRSSLIVFLLELKPDSALFREFDQPHFNAYLRKVFLNHLKEIDRQRNPVKKLYRQVVRILKKSEMFVTVSVAEGTYYGMSAAGPKIRLVIPDDVEHIPYPINIPLNSTVKKTLALAGYFCQQIAALWNDNTVLIPVKDLIAWQQYVTVFDEAQQFRGTYCIESDTPAPPAADIDTESITRLARTFSHQLTHKEKTVFTLYYENGLNLREIAASLGYRGSSGVHYPLQSVYQKLQKFLTEHSGLSPEDLNPNAFSFFFEILFKILKKTDLVPL